MIQNITEKDINAIKQGSVLEMPDNPSASGWKPREIKQAIANMVVRDDNSIVSNINRIVDETNSSIEEVREQAIINKNEIASMKTSVDSSDKASAYAQQVADTAKAGADQSKARVDQLESQVVEKQGTSIYVNGIPTARVNVDSDIQGQLNDRIIEDKSSSVVIDDIAKTAMYSYVTTSDIPYSHGSSLLSMRYSGSDSRIQLAFNHLSTQAFIRYKNSWENAFGDWKVFGAPITGQCTNVYDNGVSISMYMKSYQYLYLRGNANGYFSMIIPNINGTYSTSYLTENLERQYISFTYTDGILKWGKCGFFKNNENSFQDRTNTGYYDLWEVRAL